jgi:hypothetical protein
MQKKPVSAPQAAVDKVNDQHNQGQVIHVPGTVCFENLRKHKDSSGECSHVTNNIYYNGLHFITVLLMI